MTKKGQRVEGGMIVAYFSANVCYIQWNVLSTFCSQDFDISNGEKNSSNKRAISNRDCFD